LFVRNFRLFATGQLVSLLGGWIQITAQDWLVLSISHNSPTALGFVTALQFTPVLLFSLYGGKLADRFDKRKLLIIANIAYGVLALIMGALVVTGIVQVWHVYVFAACYGMVNSMETPARQAFVSEMVGRELLPNAMSLSSATFNSARILGPAIGGVTIAALGTGTAFLVNAVTFIAPVIAIARMNPNHLYRDAPAGRVAAADARIIDGLRYVRQRADLLLPILLMLVVGLAAFNFQITLALMAKDVFHADAKRFGLLTTCLAVGALIGAFAGSARKSRPSVWLVLGSCIAFTSLEIVVAFAPTFLLTGLLLIPTGFCMLFFAQATNQRVQMGVGGDMRGRVMALYVMVFLGTTPIGAPVVGWVSAVLGSRSGLWLGGSVSLVAGLVALTIELRRTGARLRVTAMPPRLRVITGELPISIRPEPIVTSAEETEPVRAA
jgi:MFS family permease